MLDAGAGSGTFTKRLAARGFDVTSTDVTDEALDVLRSRVSGAVERADATSLPFAANSFDAVILGRGLEHVENDTAALGEAARVLRSGGVLGVTVPRNPAWFSRSDEWAGHFRRYTREQLESRVTEAGFEIVTCKAWGFPISALYHRTVFERVVAREAISSKPIELGVWSSLHCCESTGSSLGASAAPWATSSSLDITLRKLKPTDKSLSRVRSSAYAVRPHLVRNRRSAKPCQTRTSEECV